MDCCKASGFSIYSGGKWLRLDKKGNELAANVMSKSKKTNRIEVKAEGALEGTLTPDCVAEELSCAVYATIATDTASIRIDCHVWFAAV